MSDLRVSRNVVDANVQTELDEFFTRYAEKANDAAFVSRLRDELLVHATLKLVWKSVDIYADDIVLRASLRHATSWQFMVYAVTFVDGEIRNGGFHQLFFNSTGILVEDARQGLIALGENVRADLITRAASKFKNGIVPKDRGVRVEALERFNFESEWCPFAEPLETEYYALEEASPLGAVCARFIEANPDAFFR